MTRVWAVGLVLLACVSCSFRSSSADDDTSVCKVTKPMRIDMAPLDLDFSDLVHGRPSKKYVSGMGAALWFVDADADKNAGEDYRPVFRFLLDSYLATVPEENVNPPYASSAVRSSASKLDVRVKDCP